MPFNLSISKWHNLNNLAPNAGPCSLYEFYDNNSDTCISSFDVTAAPSTLSQVRTALIGILPSHHCPVYLRIQILPIIPIGAENNEMIEIVLMAGE